MLFAEGRLLDRPATQAIHWSLTPYYPAGKGQPSVSSSAYDTLCISGCQTRTMGSVAAAFKTINHNVGRGEFHCIILLLELAAMFNLPDTYVRDSQLKAHGW